MPDKRNKSTEFLMQTMPELINSELNCHTLGRVLRYDKVHHRCDVQILPLQSDGEKRAALTEVVVPKSISFLNTVAAYIKSDVVFKAGSVVWLGFFDRDSDNFNGSGNNFKIETRRMHSLQDAFVGGVIKS